MERILTEICADIRNYFKVGAIHGKFVVIDGQICNENGDAISAIQNGQYFRIIGSVFNDGVHKFPAELQDENIFEGSIWLMAVPSAVVSLASEIDAWCVKNEAIDSPAMSPFTSESFGGYSYSKSGSDGSSITWKQAFKAKLNTWRKI